MPKLRERVKQFRFGAMPYMLTVVISNDLASSIQKRVKRYRLTPQNDPNMRACVFGSEDCSASMMFLPNTADISQLVHECSHVVWFMLRYAEIELQNELVAYHIGHLSNEVAQLLWGKTRLYPQRCSRGKGRKCKGFDNLTKSFAKPVDKSRLIC